MQLIDGKKIASELLSELSEKIVQFPRKIGLSFILIGAHPASKTYVHMKKKACARVGIRSFVHELPLSTSQETLLDLIHQLNQDSSIDGILVQLPLPAHFEVNKVTQAIHPQKDIDGFHPENLGKLLLGEEDGFIPCTPLGIQVLLERSQISVEGKHVVIVGRSSIVGKPLGMLLLQKKREGNATVTYAHSATKNLSEVIRSADLLVAAMGCPRFIRGEMVKKGVVVIDVGINRLGSQLVGDVDFDSVAPRASYITPVPGGVGPMTIALLMQNTYESAMRRGV